MAKGSKFQDQSRLLACCWRSTPHAKPTMCLVGLEESSVQGLLLGITTNIGGEVDMSYSQVFQFNRLIGDVRLPCVHIFLRGILTLGLLSLWGRKVTFSPYGHSRITHTKNNM